MRVYIDTVLVIYLVEQDATFAPSVEAWLRAHPCDLAASELTRMETLAYPVRAGDVARIADFEQFFATQVTELVATGRPVFDKAIEIRAAFPAIRTPDAIHFGFRRGVRL